MSKSFRERSIAICWLLFGPIFSSNLMGQVDRAATIDNGRITASKSNRELNRSAPQRQAQRDSAPAIQSNGDPANAASATTPAFVLPHQATDSAASASSGLKAYSASFSRPQNPSPLRIQDEAPQPIDAEGRPISNEAATGVSNNTDGDSDDNSSNESGDDADDDEGADNEPWRLFQLPRAKQHDISVRGWLAQGFTWNPDRPADRSNGVLGMNDRSNDYLFNQLGLVVDKPLDTDVGDWSMGWRVGLMYGADARFVQSLGFDDDWNSGRFVSLAMPELFVDLFVPWGNGASLRVGRFWSPIGYEGVPALDRFFYSATNAFMLAEPSTHTGLMLKYPMGDQWTIQGGMVQGWDVWRDNNDSLGAIGTLGWISADEDTTVTGVFYSGDETDELDDNQFTYSLMLTHQISERWRYLLWHDFNAAQDVALDSLGGTKDGQWYAVTNALFYAVSDSVSLGGRLEWFRDDDGVRIFHPVTGDNLGAGDLFGLTVGANYTPTNNLLLRPEVRWDWSNRVIPFDDQTDRQQFTAALDVVWQF